MANDKHSLTPVFPSSPAPDGPKRLKDCLQTPDSGLLYDRFAIQEDEIIELPIIPLTSGPEKSISLFCTRRKESIG
jgi:hypothetical protein